MTTNQFIEEAAKNDLKVYKVEGIKSGDNKGYKITFAEVLNETTVSTEKTEEFWNVSLSEIADRMFRN